MGWLLVIVLELVVVVVASKEVVLMRVVHLRSGLDMAVAVASAMVDYV